MTRKLRVIAAATAVATLGAGLVSGTAIAAGSADAVATQAVQSSQIEVGPSWKDTDGNLLEAHGGAANKVNEAEFGIDVTGDGDTDDDVYLLYGEKKTNATRPVDGINGYWSTDLENWHYMGNVLRTHNVLPNKVISISGDESYTDYDSQQYFADHKVSQDGKTTNYAAGSQKYTVLDEANLQTLKDLANSGEDTEDAKSAKAFIEPYVTERDSNGKAIAYDEASLKIGFEYLYGMYNIVERPKVVYNKATKQFVAIFHSDGAVNANADRIKWIEGLTKSGLGVTGGKTYFEQGIANNDATAKNTGSRYSRAQIGFAVSDSPFGPFKMVNSTRMNFDKSLHATRFGESRDMTVFVDYGHDVNNDGADDAYAVYSSEMNAKMYISLLNKEYTAPIAAGDSEPEGDHTWRSRVLPDNSREASALFYHDGWYYMITSGTDGWNSTPVIYYRAKSVLQDAVWEKLGNPFTGDNPSKGYDSQPTYVLVEDQDKGQFIYMGDRWVVDGRTGSAGQNSKLIWLPIEITGNADKPINISGRASWNPFDESLYSAPKDYGSIVLEQGSLLPETLKIDGRDVAVSWADGANDQVVSAAAGATLSLNFTVDGARYNVSVQIIAPGLTYYVDSGAKDEASASDYAAVKAAVPGLKNATPDQVSDGTGWGYVSSNVVAKSDAGNGKADTGLYTNNSGTIISYKLPLDAGSYTLDAGFHDWWAQWTDNRAMDLTVAAADGAELGKGSAATSKSAADATGTVSFTLDKAQTVTFSVTRAANATADPILNWFTVSKKATVLDSTIVATAGKLPATVSIDGKDTAVTWSAASVSAASAKASVVASINATGSADGTPVSATVLNVPANTVYFADSGAAASAATPDYDAVKAALGDALLNQSADQQWDGKASGKTWGYSGGTGTGVVDAKSNGWNNSFVSADYDSKNGQITYHLTLKAGKYNIGAVQSHVKYPNGIYSTVKVGDETIGARKTLTGLSDANDTVVQSVEVAKDSVVDVTVGTDGNSGYNLRLAAVWAAKTGDVTVPETPVVDVDQANFPDAAFLKLVKDYDTNGNGNLSDKEIAAVTDITAPVAGIKDLKGIEHFTALKQLIVDRNEITAVDLSTLVNLEKLDLSSNKLTALDVSKLTGLKRLDIADNQIAPALDLSANGKLTYINVGVNALAAIRLPETTQHALTSINAKDQIAVEVQATDGVFDLKTIADWFDPAKVNDLKGAELDGTTLKNITGDTVTYDYVIPDGKIKYTLPVTLKVTAAQPSVDKSDLQAAVDEAGKLVESDYTAESWEAFASALRNANTVLVDDQATQESVDDAVRRLAEARGALKPADKPSVDKSDLQAAVDAAGELTESDYTAESWEAFASALRNAN
ncbi:leucine-rich repeat domain-containing protein, partial [Bifidobacterium vespertilionis]